MLDRLPGPDRRRIIKLLGTPLGPPGPAWALACPARPGGLPGPARSATHAGLPGRSAVTAPVVVAGLRDTQHAGRQLHRASRQVIWPRRGHEFWTRLAGWRRWLVLLVASR